MDEILETLSNTAGIDASLLVGKDGLVITQAGRTDDFEVDAVAATASEMYNSAEQMMSEKSNGGAVETLVFEAARGRYLLNAVNDEVFLMVLAGKKANLGLVRWETKESAARLKDVL
ncbi:MAG: hypothetical protein FJX76_06900 [Armatimonadetes bacterium]|nr:hypothetical protein [Armatimonadota bacterium]